MAFRLFPALKGHSLAAGDGKTCHHFYAYDRSTSSVAVPRLYGRFELRPSGLAKVRIRREEDWLEAINECIQNMAENRNGLLFYIHGFQADNTWFVRKSGQVIQSQILNHPGHRYGLAVSLQWSSPLVYSKAVLTALAKGERFATLAARVTDMLKARFPDAPVSVLCHSMGNRVWQGMYESWTSMDPDLKLDKVFMFAADLEADILSYGFPGLDARADKVLIYHHLEDRTLIMARTFAPHFRLGQVGPSFPELLPDNFIFRDVTGLDDDQSFAGKVTFHRYYYGSPSVRREIVRYLS